MNIFVRLPGLVAKFLFASFAIWVILSTAVPQIMMKFSDKRVRSLEFDRTSYPYNSITSPTPMPISDSAVYYIIGHPDDEVMFFSPSLIEMIKPIHNNTVHLICFLDGGAEHASMGRIRSEELFHSARILGLDSNNVKVLSTFKDGMNETWDSNAIRSALYDIINTNEQPLVLVTFDEHGVSNHPNHISLFHGTLNYFRSLSMPRSKRIFVLKSLNFWEKYSFTLLTNVELFVSHFSQLVMRNLFRIDIHISFFGRSSSISAIKFYLDLNMLSVSYAAMAYGHYSQMVWFRYGWLLCSRYLTFNHLIQL